MSSDSGEDQTGENVKLQVVKDKFNPSESHMFPGLARRSSTGRKTFFFSKAPMQKTLGAVGGAIFVGWVGGPGFSISGTQILFLIFIKTAHELP